MNKGLQSFFRLNPPEGNIYLEEMSHDCAENDEQLVRGILTGPYPDTTIEWRIEDRHGRRTEGIDYCPFCGLRLLDTMKRLIVALEETKDGP